MEMPQGALPKTRRQNEGRSKGKQYKDHVNHTEYFCWMETAYTYDPEFAFLRK